MLSFTISRAVHSQTEAPCKTFKHGTDPPKGFAICVLIDTLIFCTKVHDRIPITSVHAGECRQSCFIIKARLLTIARGANLRSTDNV